MPVLQTNESVTVTEAGIRICQSDNTRETLNITNLGTGRVSIVQTFAHAETTGYPIPSNGFVNYSNIWNDAVKHSVIMKALAGGGTQECRVQMTYKEAY